MLDDHDLNGDAQAMLGHPRMPWEHRLVKTTYGFAVDGVPYEGDICHSKEMVEHSSISIATIEKEEHDRLWQQALITALKERGDRLRCIRLVSTRVDDPTVPAKEWRDGLPTPQVFERALHNVVYLTTCPGGLSKEDEVVVSRGMDELAEFYKRAWGGEENGDEA